MSFSLMNFIWIYLEFQIVDFRDSYSIDYTSLYKTQHNNLYEMFNTKVRYHEVLDFKDNGINLNLILTPGADKVSAAVLSGDADIGFAGSETTIYVYNGGEKDYLKTFAQLTQKDGSFIVSRKKIDNFTLDDLKGKDVIGGRAGGMPEMTFEWALKEHNIDPKKDVNIDTSIAFAAMSSAFIGGQGDFVTLFDDSVIKRKSSTLNFLSVLLLS